MSDAPRGRARGRGRAQEMPLPGEQPPAAHQQVGGGAWGKGPPRFRPPLSHSQPSGMRPAHPQQPGIVPAQSEQPAMRPAQPQHQSLRLAHSQQLGIRPTQSQQPPLMSVRQPGMRPAQLQQPIMRPAQQQQPGIRPSQPQQHTMRPAQQQQPGIRPSQPQQPIMRPGQPQQPIRPLQPQQPIMRPAQPQQPIMGPSQPQQPIMRPAQPQQPIMRPAQPQQPIMKPAQPQQLLMRPAQPQQPGIGPAQPQQPGIVPAQPQQFGMRPAQPQHLGMRPTRPQQAGMRPAQSEPVECRQVSPNVPSDIRTRLPMQQHGLAELTHGQARPLQPGQVAQPVTGQPRMLTRAPPTEQHVTAPTTRPDTSQSRAFYRGSERAQAAITRAQQAEATGLPLMLETLSIIDRVGSSNGGNGDSGNGGDGNGSVSVGRGMSRGAGRRLDDRVPVLRPHDNCKIGKSERAPIKLKVNYFELERNADWHLYLYHVDYSPEQDDRRQRYQIMEPHLKAHFGGHVFDGQAIFSINRLAEKTTFTSKTDVVYTVTVTLVKTMDSMDQQFIRFLNLILNRCQGYINLKLIGRHYFNTADAVALDPQLHLRVFPGYQTSIRQHEEKILLNVEIVHKFMQEMTVLDKMQQSRSKEERDADLIGSIVMARYNNLTYRVDGILDDESPKTMFNYRGSDITFIDYYKEKYNITITNPNQPLLLSKPTKQQIRRGLGLKELKLIPELMNVTGIPEDMRRNYNLMKMLADYTKMGVDKRVEALRRFNQRLLSSERVTEDLTRWGLKLSENLVTVDSRILPFENVYLDRITTNHPPDAADWTSECRNKSMAYVVQLKNWAVLVSRRFDRDVASFINTLQRAAQSVGMVVAQPEVVSVFSFNDCEREILRLAGKQLIMVIMDRVLANKYGALKRVLACQVGVLSQCVLGNNLSKKGIMSIATKIAIQINAKLGGEPWRIDQPAKTAMVVGYDVYHDSTSPNRSFGAVVSSINPQCTRFYGQVTPHHNKEELSDNFAVSIRNAVDFYHRSNDNKYPHTVIIYRDGVGEGQVDLVKEHEVPPIKRQLAGFGTQPPIGLLFIVVCKRINTRMFADLNGRLLNPPPGTVLDKTITMPHWYDFFLVSQKVTQGTVSPTSYNVLEDTTRFSVDHVQRITYKLTHLYFNWQGTVRVPAPCLYAHKLAYMTGTGTHDLPKTKLSDKLWFI